MDLEVVRSIEAWEAEGGAISMVPPLLRGRPDQVEWAGRIRPQVNDEFDRVARAFRSVASHQCGSKRAATETIIAILEDKRAEVMSCEDAGYFIRDWQEIHDQVRQMIGKDSRYQTLRPRESPFSSL
jgi:hypothetical protein